MNLKIRLSYTDRIGIVADISKKLADNALNIIFMEVVRKDNHAVVYLEIEGPGRADNPDTFIRQLQETDGIREIDFIDTLPQEEREDRFRVVLDNISDGVISIDRDGKVTTINRVACRVYGCRPGDIIGRSIRRIDLPQYPILDCLDGHSLKNVKQNLIAPHGRYQYLSTCRPIRDTSGMIVGAVEFAKDMQEIKQMARSYSDPSLATFSDIIGKNPTIKAAIAFAQKISSTDSPVAIRGSSGTGKELFAKAVHMASNRPGRFIPINCAALPDPLLESELFGYESGAFTGSRKEGKAGLFEIAHDGTVFLDEIADMSLASQAKLLRLIQEGAVRRLGGNREIPINARIITATNKNLEQRVEEESFRKDLYYRISVLPIHIPPLSQRADDIPLLVDHFLFRLTHTLDEKMPALTPQAYDKLNRHHWPGNIRELKNVVERAAIFCDGPVIDVDSIFFSHEMQNIPLPVQDDSRLNRHPLKEQVAELEKKIIISTLKKATTIRQSAKLLGLSHPALINKMKKYRIKKTTQITVQGGTP